MSVTPVPLPAGVRYAGDAALLMMLGPASASLTDAFDERLNALAIGIASQVRAAAIPGVLDVVPTFRSVAVHFDPLRTDLRAVAALLHSKRESPPDTGPPRIVDLPVVYGGSEGPDLADVAGLAGCSEEEVVARHSSVTYRVFMLGFLPGFPYLASVDARIAAPRRAVPRVRVPAGSVGIAGRQTGVYPRESPGGWQIIGRTPQTLFDATKVDPAFLLPGDGVRFVPVRGPVTFAPAPQGVADAQADTRRVVTVVSPGLFTTVQDSGRWGLQHQGVPVAGPMDAWAHDLANAIVGNSPDAAAIEATLLGPELRFEQPAVFAITGADLGATIDGAEVPLGVAVAASAGSRLRFGERRHGARAYVALSGGIEIPAVLGSRATHARSRLGGIEGRALKAGDRLPLGVSDGQGTTRRQGLDAARVEGGARLRVLPGPQRELCGTDALDVLQQGRFTVLPQSDRMGYRLSGNVRIGLRGETEMVSDAAFMGAVQVPPSGEPILLMADRQTTGGYPQLAIVISADLPLAGQLAPGDWIEFALCTHEEALAALIGQEGRVRADG